MVGEILCKYTDLVDLCDLDDITCMSQSYWLGQGQTLVTLFSTLQTNKTNKFFNKYKLDSSEEVGWLGMTIYIPGGAVHNCLFVSSIQPFHGQNT